MARELTQRELRNNSGEIMRALDRGESFVVTRNGVPVAELLPFRHRQFVPAALVKDLFGRGPSLDRQRFRRDTDAFVEQDPTPRG